MKATNVEKKISDKKIEAIVVSEVSKSQKIRQLFEGGLTVQEISKVLDIRYNFAYNVLQNHCIVHDIAVSKTPRTGNRAPVVQMLQADKSLVEIARATKLNYNYVWRIANEEGFTKKSQNAADTAETSAQQ